MSNFQQFLDTQQYSLRSITRYEKIFGAGYVSTGGQETTTDFVAKLNLQPGQRVLDVGCGIGGGNFYMAEKFVADVVGIDLSKNMIQVALDRAKERQDLKVAFAVEDATTVEYEPESFDVVYSRDTILHIEDKAALFDKFFKWLKPGGIVMISDYCCGHQQPSERFQAYVAQRGYHLLTPAEYGKVLGGCGFVDVQAEDMTDRFVQVLSSELARTKACKDDFIADTSQEDYDAIITGWEAKIQRCGDGDQKWGFFMAKKPSL